MTQTLLQRARANRLKAVNSLWKHKADNVFYIEEGRLGRGAADGPKFSTIRRQSLHDRIDLTRRLKVA